MVVLDTEVLIWSVEIVIREPEADQEALRSESFLEGVDHWNGASLANKDRLTSEAGLESLLRRLDRRSVTRNDDRAGTMVGTNLDLDGIGSLSLIHI